MRIRSTYAIILSTLAAAAVVSTGCQDDETEDNSSSTSTSTSSSSSSSSTGDGGTGGSTSSGTGGSGGSTSSGTGGGGGAGGFGPDECPTTETTHLLINEICTQGTNAEFLEIRNAGSAAVNLDNYYLSDNSIYHSIAAGDAWAPGGTPETDFLIGFPAGASIGVGETLVIEFGTDFEGAYSTCPDFTVRSGVTCNSTAVPQMTVPANGGLGANVGALLSNGGEMAMLFCWTPGHLVHDVDYVNWDADPDVNTHVDKTTVTGYVADTAMATQQAVAVTGPTNGNSMGRCDDDEDSETTTGGNGLLGHDETSEDWSTSFEIQAAVTPGAANNCN